MTKTIRNRLVGLTNTAEHSNSKPNCTTF